MALQDDCGLCVSLFLTANLPHPPWCCCPHAALHPIWDGDCALFRSASAPTDSAVCGVSTVVESCEQRYKNNILMLKQKLQMEQFDSHTQKQTRKHRHTWRALRAKMDLGATPETEIRCVGICSVSVRGCKMSNAEDIEISRPRVWLKLPPSPQFLLPVLHLLLYSISIVILWLVLCLKNSYK